MHCIEKIFENLTIVPQKRYILMVAILLVENLISGVKNVTYSMIKSSNEKSFKKDIHIFKIQGNSKCCTQRGDSNCEDCYIFGPICINKTFQKYRVSCHNLFLLRKRKTIHTARRP